MWKEFTTNSNKLKQLTQRSRIPILYYTFWTLSHKWRNKTLSFATSVRLQISAPLPLGRFFVRFYTEALLRNSVKKIHILAKSDKNIGNFTWSVFHIVVSAMCNATIQITQCCASMTGHSIFITLWTGTFVHHHYKGKALLLFHAKWLSQRTTIFMYCILFFFSVIKPSLQLTCFCLKESSKLWKALNCIQRWGSSGVMWAAAWVQILNSHQTSQRLTISLDTGS